MKLENLYKAEELLGRRKELTDAVRVLEDLDHGVMQVLIKDLGADVAEKIKELIINKIKYVDELITKL